MHAAAYGELCNLQSLQLKRPHSSQPTEPAFGVASHIATNSACIWSGLTHRTQLSLQLKRPHSSQPTEPAVGVASHIAPN